MEEEKLKNELAMIQDNMFTALQMVPFSFAALFPVLNPLGNAMTFLNLTLGSTPKEQTKLAVQVAVNTAVLLIIVLFAGSWIMRFFGITIPIVQVGGGFVVAYIGWKLLNQPSSESYDQPIGKTDKDFTHLAFFPLTMPITAGPGCIAVTLTIGARQLVPTSFTQMTFGYLGLVIGILLSAISVFFCYGYAGHITRALGAAGRQVILRLSAFINLCIGLEIVWHGIQGLLTFAT
jgi:multiple antibiotic resistance protein